jgi:phenylalanine-4-hydroxylase
MEKQFCSNRRGVYDMAGEKVVSAFSGPADANSFDMITHMPSSTTIKSKTNC